MSRPRTWIARAAGALVLVGGLGVLALGVPAVWTRWMAQDRVLTVEQAPARDVAIIYGAEVYPSGKPSPYLRARLDRGVELYRAGKAKVFIVSGDNADAHNHEATNMKKYLVAQGVPADQVVEDAYGLDTYDTCVRARKVFGVDSALLVSQRYHLPRAVATCRSVGVDAVGVGDVSVKQTSQRWDEFARRELGANVKMVWDLVRRRDPVLEPPRNDVQRALR